MRQGVIDFPQLRGKVGKVSGDIGGHLFAAVYARVFLDVGSHFFGYREMMAKNGAEKFLHGSRFWGFRGLLVWGLRAYGVVSDRSGLAGAGMF
jgi:hypothetical protein